MFDREKHTLMILRGCAGTGKTSLAGAFVRTMMKLGQKVVLMAPTGRAAKVFSLNSGSPASTIHRKIYRQKGIIGGFALDINLHKNTLFIVDEASMIANDGMMESVFGSGRLL
ncbi:MAG: AAA family ATPase, partial [Prevotella sp.]|nr:AAA family ATPase [Prevotella sp.]